MKPRCNVDTRKKYGFREDTTHQAIIYEIGSEADSDAGHLPDTPGMVVGSSEWGWISEEHGRRICAALNFFSGIPTEEIERLARDVVPVLSQAAPHGLEIRGGDRA